VDMLFERFVSKERNEPPDIDVDFEHERREEVIQYIYAKYGRHRAALCAEVITYRGRSALRDVGKAMGLSLDLVDRLAKQLDWWEGGMVAGDRLREMGLDPSDPTIRMTLELAHEILGFPRHLSQHVGGFVISQDPLEEIVPIENAAMPDRTVIEWDKDDIDAMGMMKVDCLGLGMLTAISKGFGLVNGWEKVSRCQGVEVSRGREPTHGAIGKETNDGLDPLVPRCDRVAEGQGTQQADLPSDGEDAEIGTLRPDRPDATGVCVNPIEHRGGVQPEDAPGVHSRPADRLGLSGGTLDAVGDRDRVGHDAQRSRDSCIDGRSGPDALRTDPEARDASEIVVIPSALPLTPRHLDTSTPYLELHTVPAEDPAVYEMICHADTIGIFQVESRAQMSMLPRLKPRNYYDLVIEVAIVRPGPIQGDMVHPYLRRRTGQEPVWYPSPEVEGVLKRTLGVPLFQEQAMQMAVVAGGFTPGESDQLRRAIAAWKRSGNKIMEFGTKLRAGMIAKGYTPKYADQVFKQIQGFSGYGFPESHAASFALLVYTSAWLKRYHPAAFTAALLNSQPMGFYAPAQLVRDAREHGVEVREVDVNHSGYDCRLERAEQELSGRRGIRETQSGSEQIHSSSPGLSGSPETSEFHPPSIYGHGGPALRLGMRLVAHLGEAPARAIEEAVNAHGRFNTVTELWRAAGVPVASLRALARADCFRSMGLDRRRALWEIRDLRDERLPLFEEDSPAPTSDIPLPPLAEDRHVIQDYATLGLSLRAHPVSFLRDTLDAAGITPCGRLRDEAAIPHGTPIAVAGLVLCRQRPGTASGIVFMTLEDETGPANLIIRPHIYERHRPAARHSACVIARGHVERQGEVVHVVVDTIEAIHPGTGRDRLVVQSRDFH
jgi:error-prone DNA polymerase